MMRLKFVVVSRRLKFAVVEPQATQIRGARAGSD
jgi:hypothetical protein